MKAIDITVSNLCEEVDFLRAEVAYWKGMYEQEIRERNEETNQRLIEARKGVANALVFALSVRDDENGNLVIPAKERKQLAKYWK